MIISLIRIKNFQLYLVGADFKKEFDKDDLDAHITTDLILNITPPTIPQQQLLDRINSILPKGYKFSHITKKKIKTIINKLYMSYEYYINQPMQAVELKLNMIFLKIQIQ